MSAANLCIIYVSEAVNNHLLQRLASFLSIEGKIALAHSFQDVSYNRTSFYLLSRESEYIEPALELCKHALESLDFDRHSGSHPALGIIDHVCISPLGDANISSTVSWALDFGSRLHEAHNLPIFSYGYASTQQERLQSIRRSLGYFDQAKLLNDRSFSFGQFTAEQVKKSALHPTFGTVEHVTAKSGICCLGVVPFVRNFNIRFRKSDTKASIAKITAHVRCPEMEALTLKHEEGSFEIACNLLQSKVVTPDMVLAQVQELAQQYEVEIVHSYTTGPSEEELLAMLPPL